jgi:hypothetical protein
MMRLDIGYVRNMSMWLDIKIIAKTPLAILGQVRDSLQKKTVPWRPAASLQTALIVTGNAAEPEVTIRQRQDRPSREAL